ncbi:MAG: DUF4339 domain-containing protein [Proteobacteria bacterium]|nr:DUF4339 domain-containing protein [Pseudomonadota bacterium]
MGSVTDKWYYNDYGKKGPVSIDELRDLYRRGKVSESTPVWPAGEDFQDVAHEMLFKESPVYKGLRSSGAALSTSAQQEGLIHWGLFFGIANWVAGGVTIVLCTFFNLAINNPFWMFFWFFSFILAPVLSGVAVVSSLIDIYRRKRRVKKSKFSLLLNGCYLIGFIIICMFIAFAKH